MIKLPIKPWTPPIKIPDPKPQNAVKPTKPKPPAASGGNGGSGGGSNGGGSGGSGGSGGGSGGTGGSEGGGAQNQPAIPSFEELFEEMLKKYLPETVEFTPLSEEELSETIRNWLRPAYEQAIQNRREQTGRINAELDADAWSRGMGQSTYLSDVKARQYRNESGDVDALESNYAAALAGHLYDAIKAQQEKKIEVDEFNAEAINRAREKAMEAARALYEAYLSGTQGQSADNHSGGHSGGAGTKTKTNAEGTQEKSFRDTLLANLPGDQPKTDYRTAASIVARMSPQERKRLYNLSDPAYRQLRGELVYSLGRDGFNRLIQDYPV